MESAGGGLRSDDENMMMSVKDRDGEVQPRGRTSERAGGGERERKREGRHGQMKRNR